MDLIDELVIQIKKEVDDELTVKCNETNNEVDSTNKMDGKRKHVVPATNTDVHSPITKRRKRNYHGEKVTELKPFCRDLFIFTTRLDEMRLFKRDFNKLNRLHIWEEILRESKPVYSQHIHDITTQTILKDENIQKLYNDLDIINNKQSLKVIDIKKLCQAKEINEEMKVVSINENHGQINVIIIPDNETEETLKLKVCKGNSILIDDKRSSDNTKEILNNSNNEITSDSDSDISEGTLICRPEKSNEKLVTVSPENVVLETNKSLMEIRKSDIQVMEPSPRTSPEQFYALLGFMERHGDLSRKEPGLEGHIKNERLWHKLKNMLNSICGGKKSTDKWKKVWTDWKAKSKKKSLRLRQEASGTGGGPSSEIILTAVEGGVVSVVRESAAKTQAAIREQGFNRTSSEPLHDAGSATEPPLPLESNYILHIVSEGQSENIESPPVVTSMSTNPSQLRARRKRRLSLLEREADPLAAIEQRLLRNEEERVERDREYETESERLEAEREDVLRERKLLYHQLSLLSRQLNDVMSKKRRPVDRLPSTDLY